MGDSKLVNTLIHELAAFVFLIVFQVKMQVN